VVSKWCQKFVDYTSLVPLRSTTLCDGHWYLDAVLGRDLYDPPHIWLVLKDGQPRLTVHWLTYLLEEALVEALRTPPHLGTLSAP
jgi:hypothetical protein